MSTILLDGKVVSASILKRVKGDVAKLKKRGVRPKLAFILVGKNPASLAYVSQKEKACKKVGIEFLHVSLPEKTPTKKLIAIIEKFNRDRKIHGILVQLPLPHDIETPKIIKAIDPSKDVDGFHAYNLGKMFLSTSEAGAALRAAEGSRRSRDSLVFEYLTPCTPTGVVKLLEYYRIPIEGRNVVVVGRSNIVGKPLAIMLLNRGATVTICHRGTKNLFKHTKEADILCVAAGVPGLIKGNMVKKGCVIIDVGFNRLTSGKIVGDVLFDSVKKKARFITPVPGGVGPMTVACLMENVVKAARRGFAHPT